MINQFRFIILIFFITVHLFNPGTVKCAEYSLSLATDIPLVSAGIITLSFGKYLGDKQEPLTDKEINSSDRDDVNPFDRSATYNYSKTGDKWSNYTRNILVFSPAVFAGFDEPRSDFHIIAVMYLESIAIEEGLTSIVKSAADRKRPYVYNSDVPLEKKTNKDSTRSFYSGHTSTAFNSAVFISTVFSDYYPDSGMRYVVWITSLTLASTTGYLRYAAGKHYPSDIIAGAAAGAVTGYTVPALHRKKESQVSVIPLINPGYAGAGIQFMF